MLYIFVMYASAASDAPERRSRFPRKRNKASDKSVPECGKFKNVEPRHDRMKILRGRGEKNGADDRD
jgi:hypothetical protein